jgi:hypothetical protein
MPLKKGSSKRVISENIGEMVGKYKRTGTLGSSKPGSTKKAAAQAAAIAYDEAGKARKPKKAAGGGAMKKPKGAFMMVKRRDADQKTAIY